MSSWTCLQDLLRARASSEIIGGGRLLFYPIGKTNSPRVLSYKCLYKQAKELSNIIIALQGFVETSSVLLHLDEQCDVILWFWAVLLANGLPVLSTPFSHVDEHRRNHIQGLASLLSSPICITRSTSLHLFGKESGLQLYTIESLLNGKNAACPRASPESPTGFNTGHACIGKPGTDGPAMLMLTSGSTGNSKAVQLTHKNVLAAVAGKSSIRPLPQDKPFLSWIGLDHVGALVEIHLHALCLGVDQIHVHAVDVVSSPLAFLDLLSRHQVSRSFTPNFFLAKLVASFQAQPEPDAETLSHDLSGLCFLVSGGEANNVETYVTASSLLTKFGAPPNTITPGFSMTETCAGCIYNIDCPNYDLAHDRTVASLGKCIEGMEMRIVVSISETKMRLAEPGEVGELQLRGNNVFGGNYRNPDATSKAFTPGGWFNTGDQAAIDLDGNLGLFGRALGALVSRLVVFATRATHTEQVTIAYVPKLQASRSDDILEINRLAAELCFLSTASRPPVFSLGEKSASCLPISTLGKISRAKRRVLFEEGNFTEDVDHYQLSFHNEEARKGEYTTHTPITDIETCLINEFADLLGLGASDISVDTPLLDMGFTSMDLIRLKRRIEANFGPVPIITILKHPTARLLAAVLCSETDSDGKLDNSQADSTEPCIYNPVVSLRSEWTKTPLWLIHPGVGEVLVFVGRGVSKEWVTIDGWDGCGRIIARAAERMMLGLPMGRNEELLKASRLYANSVLLGGVVINCFPPLLRKMVAPVISLRAKYYQSRCVKILVPLIDERLKLWHQGKEGPDDFLQWLIATCAKDGPHQLHAPRIANRLIALMTPLIFAVCYMFAHSVLDLYANPSKDDFVSGLEGECRSVSALHGGLSTTEAVDSLYRVDSTIRESMRTSDVAVVNLYRDVMAGDLDIGNGTVIPQGMRMAFPTQNIHLDPDNYEDPLRFDAFRFSRKFEGIDKSTQQNVAHERELIVTPTLSFLPLGYGRHACPGRWFAAQTMKQALAYIILNYDVELLGGPVKRKALLNTMVPPVDAKLRIRRRS